MRQKTKRANQTGTISYDRARKCYHVRVWIDGRRRKVSARTQAEAWARAEALKVQSEAGPAATDYTVTEWLTEWLNGADGLSPVTVENYRSHIRNHIAPAIGSYRLADLTPVHVRQMLTAMKAKGLSGNTQRLAKATLHRGLAIALELELISRNAATFKGVGTPVKAKPGRSLTAQQVQQLHDAARLSGEQFKERYGASVSSTIGPLVFLLVSTGLRRGEALGLQWSDVDLDARTLTVRQSVKTVGGKITLGATKTDGSRRTINVPAETVAILRSLDQTTTWVFPSQQGSPLDPPGVTRRVKTYTKAVLGEAWGPHEMRHTCASLLVSNGVSMKVVSDLLGHSSVTLTANTYAHLSPAARSETASAYSKLLTPPTGVRTMRRAPAQRGSRPRPTRVARPAERG